jgi:hypothetical protein
VTEPAVRPAQPQIVEDLFSIPVKKPAPTPELKRELPITAPSPILVLEPQSSTANQSDLVSANPAAKDLSKDESKSSGDAKPDNH